MFLTRKIGGFLRGKATRGQVLAASLLAGLLGFVPGSFLPGDLGGGFLQAPGLILCVLFLVLVLNANLGVFGFVALIAKLLSLPLLPVSFAVGRFLIEGPLQPLFRALVNAPVFAWFGLEYYATTGGLVLGALFGVVAGSMLVRSLRTFRTRMAHVEATSAVYQARAHSPWVRFVAWLLFGKGKGARTSWQDLAESQRRGLPVRLSGVALVAVLAGGLWVFQGYYASPLLTSGIKSGLTAANGATVDLKAAELDLAGGSLALRDLAIADSSALDHDLFAAGRLEARLDTVALLKKRFVIDELRSTDARTGSLRQTKGVRTAPPEPPPPPPAGARTLDDYLRDIETWRARLQQAREWIDVLAGSDDAPPAEQPPEVRRRELEEALRTRGYAGVAADHLRQDLPLVLIRAIDLEGVACGQLPGESLDVHATNVSTNAWLLSEPPRFQVKTHSDRLQVTLTGPSQLRPGAALEFALRRLPVDAVFAELRLAGAPPLRGGTLDLEASGQLLTHAAEPTSVELPLQVTLHDTTFALAGAKETHVDRLLLPIGVHGPVTRPRIAIDDQVLAKALVQAGQQELAGFVQTQAGKLLGNVPGAAPLLDGKTPQQMADEAKRAAEEAARKAAEEAARKAAEEAAKKGAEGLKGLLPGRKK